jgi:hypothetical protein
LLRTVMLIRRFTRLKEGELRIYCRTLREKVSRHSSCGVGPLNPLGGSSCRRRPQTSMTRTDSGGRVRHNRATAIADTGQLWLTMRNRGPSLPPVHLAKSRGRIDIRSYSSYFRCRSEHQTVTFITGQQDGGHELNLTLGACRKSCT